MKGDFNSISIMECFLKIAGLLFKGDERISIIKDHSRMRIESATDILELTFKRKDEGK